MRGSKSKSDNSRARHRESGHMPPMDASRILERCATVIPEAISKRGWLNMIPKNTVSSLELMHAKVR